MIQRALPLALALAHVLATAAAARQVTVGELTDLPPADVVVLGEVHDNPIHHENQARAVAAIEPGALVFEMLTPAQARAVTPDIRADREALETALGWRGSGWPDFGFYHPIFLAAPGARIFGGGVPRKEARRAFSEGPAAVFGDDAAAYGLTEPLPEAEQAEREAGQMAAHCDALPPEILPGLVDAQRLRDAALARAVRQALAATGGPVAVITGNGHARKDWGLPAVLARAAPEVSVLSVAQFETEPEEDRPYDLWLVTAPADREDPCAALKAE